MIGKSSTKKLQSAQSRVAKGSTKSAKKPDKKAVKK